MDRWMHRSGGKTVCYLPFSFHLSIMLVCVLNRRIRGHEGIIGCMYIYTTQTLCLHFKLWGIFFFVNQGFFALGCSLVWISSVFVCVYVCVCMYVCVCVRVYMCVCMCACVSKGKIIVLNLMVSSSCFLSVSDGRKWLRL